MALSKYRSFTGAGDYLTWSLGNLAGSGSVPQSLVFVAQIPATPGGDGEVIHADAGTYDPLDLFYVRGSQTIAYNDGATFLQGPGWTQADGWCLFALRTPSGAVAKWSKSAYNGSSWPTPTHTTTGTTYTSRSYPGSGSAQVSDPAAPLSSHSVVCVARFNTDLTDADINAMTAGMDAIAATPGCTNLWHIGASTPADLVGTSTLTTLSGATLSGTDSPFNGPTGGGGPTGPIFPPLVVSSSAITRSYFW